jgi:hypothetical protein
MQVGCSEIVGRIVEDLKDENEPYRRMVMETIDKVVRDLGTADIDARLEELLIDGILYAFQEQVSLPRAYVGRHVWVQESLWYFCFCCLLRAWVHNGV